MCSDNLTSANNDGVTNSDFQQRCETAETCCLSTGDSKITITTLDLNHPSLKANETSKKKYNKTQAMAEKRKRLPPGYVNVTTPKPPMSSPNVVWDEKSVKDTKHVCYVNTELIEKVDLQSEERNESQISLNPGIPGFLGIPNPEKC